LHKIYKIETVRTQSHPHIHTAGAFSTDNVVTAEGKWKLEGRGLLKGGLYFTRGVAMGLSIGGGTPEVQWYTVATELRLLAWVGLHCKNI
jgi:hypothetical protein